MRGKLELAGRFGGENLQLAITPVPRITTSVSVVSRVVEKGGREGSPFSHRRWSHQALPSGRRRRTRLLRQIDTGAVPPCRYDLKIWVLTGCKLAICRVESPISEIGFRYGVMAHGSERLPSGNRINKALNLKGCDAPQPCPTTMG